MSWIPIKLSELCNVVTKGTTPTSVGYDFTDQGVPFLRIQNLYDNIVNLDNVLFISRETHLVLNRSIIRPRDFLITIAGTIGRVAIVPDDFPESNCNQAIAILRFDTERLYPRFLLHWLTTQNAMSQISEKKVTATISNLSLGQIKELQIPLPPLPEQKRIAAVLDKADSIRRKRQQAIKLADEFLRAVFLEMFGDPVGNPKGWDIQKFSAVGTLDRGKSKHRPRNDPKLLGGKHPLIQTGDVANSQGYITEYKTTYSELGLQQSKKWNAGTLCITIAANIAKTGILTFDACFPDSVVGFIPNEKVTVEYIQHWLGFLQKSLEASAPESAQKNINLEILRALDLPIPSIEIQHKFSGIVNQVLALNSKNSIHSNEIENLSASLSQKAFSGQL